MGIAHNGVAFVKRHPYECAGGAAGVVVLFLILHSRNGSTATVDPATALALAKLQSSTEETLAADQVAAASNPSMYAAQASEAQSSAATTAAQAADNTQTAGLADQLKAALAATAASITNTKSNNATALGIANSDNTVQKQSIAAQLQEALSSIAGSVTIAQTSNATSLALGSLSLSGLTAQLSNGLQMLQTSILGSETLLGQQITGNLDYVNTQAADTISVNNNENESVAGNEANLLTTAALNEISVNNNAMNNLNYSANDQNTGASAGVALQESLSAAYQQVLQSLGIKGV